jgi:hypothetical protein
MDEAGEGRAGAPHPTADHLAARPIDSTQTRRQWRTWESPRTSAASHKGLCWRTHRRPPGGHSGRQHLTGGCGGVHRSTWTFGEQRTTRTLSGGVVSVGMRQSTQTTSRTQTARPRNGCGLSPLITAQLERSQTHLPDFYFPGRRMVVINGERLLRR